jgi:hypothetical protein
MTRTERAPADAARSHRKIAYPLFSPALVKRRRSSSRTSTSCTDSTTGLSPALRRNMDGPMGVRCALESTLAKKETHWVSIIAWIDSPRSAVCLASSIAASKEPGSSGRPVGVRYE